MNSRSRRSLLILATLALLLPSLPVSAAPLEQDLDAFLGQLSPSFDTIPGQTVSAKLNAGEDIFVLDVREPDEFKAGHIEGAVNIPIRTLMESVAKLPKDKAAPIVVYCRSGIRAAYGTMALKMMGYKNASDLAGGMLAWEKDALPVVK